MSIIDSPIKEPAMPPLAANAATKDELLGRAKAAVEAGERCMHDAAEALAVAQELHGASQAEMARAVGKSEAWVSLLLQWRRSGYKDESPFGPKTKAGRLKHAKDRAASGAAQPRKSRKASTARQADADDAQVSADNRKDQYAREEAKAGCATTGAQVSTSRKASPAEAKGNLMYAIEHWWPLMDDAGRVEVTAFFFKQKGVRVS